MAKKQSRPQLSSVIEGFINTVEEAQRDYDWNYEEVNRLNLLQQDLLHMLELSDLKYSGRGKVATQLRNCRIDRRASKDTVEMLEPFLEQINSDKGIQMMRFLKELLGQTRNLEKNMGVRVYRFRELDEEDIYAQG